MPCSKFYPPLPPTVSEAQRDRAARAATTATTAAHPSQPAKARQPYQRGALGKYGTVEPYLEDSNICNAERQEKIGRQMVRMILRCGLPLGFCEQEQFQALVTMLCPAYAKCSGAFPGKLHSNHCSQLHMFSLWRVWLLLPVYLYSDHRNMIYLLSSAGHLLCPCFASSLTSPVPHLILLCRPEEGAYDWPRGRVSIYSPTRRELSQ